MAHVFISYSKKNKTYAQELKVQLLNLGFDVWIDEVIEPGDGWFRSIRQAIKDCAAFVLIMTPESENSHWVNLELLHALEYHKPIFPLLRAGGSNPLDSDVWAQIANVQFTDVRDGSMPADRFYERLIKRGVPRQFRGQDITPPSVEAPSVGEGLRPSPTNPPDKTPVPEPAPPAPTPPPASSISPRPQGERQGVRAQAPLALPDVSSILPPPFEWCWIPAGKVTLEYFEGHHGVRMGGEFLVEPFWMAKYPITQAQYKAFIDAEDGYQYSQWWDYSESAKGWRSGNKWQQRPSDDIVPAITITLYEAIAFCNWLCVQVGVEEGKIGLPTEQQWQRAAQGDDGRRYPWGNKFDKNCCNTSEANHGKPVLVNMYPCGSSPFNVLDMSGNVSEWTISTLDNSIRYLLCGGSWRDNGDEARCSSRTYSQPGFANWEYGFRICYPSSIPISI